MPVNELPPEPEPDPRVERVLAQTRRAIGASDRMPVRVMVYIVVAAIATTFAPLPANVIGVAAIALLALDTALHRR